MPACTPAQCSGSDHSGGLPRAPSSPKAWSRAWTAGLPGAAARPPPTTRRAAAGENRSTEYSASTSIAGVPVLLQRPAVAAAARDRGLQCGRPQGVPPVQVAAATTAATSAAAAGSWPSCIRVQPSSSRCRCREHRVVGTVGHGPPDDAARPDRVAAVQRGQRDERRRRCPALHLTHARRRRWPGPAGPPPTAYGRSRVGSRPSARLRAARAAEVGGPAPRLRPSRAPRPPARPRRTRSRRLPPTVASPWGPAPEASQPNSSAAWPALPSCVATLAATRTAAGPLRGSAVPSRSSARAAAVAQSPAECQRVGQADLQRGSVAPALRAAR